MGPLAYAMASGTWRVPCQSKEYKLNVVEMFAVGAIDLTYRR